MANRFTGSSYSFTSNYATAYNDPRDSDPSFLSGRLLGFDVVLSQNEITK